MNFCVPYFSSLLMAQNLQHKSFWCEETFRNLFEDDTYEHCGKWRLQVGFLEHFPLVMKRIRRCGSNWRILGV